MKTFWGGAKVFCAMQKNGNAVIETNVKIIFIGKGKGGGITGCNNIFGKK